MRYLLVKEKSGKFTLYCPDIFGSDTWGMTTQLSLKKKKKYWYINHWSAGNEWIEDENYDEKLDVVLESSNLQEILNYVVKETKGNQALVGAVLVQAQKLHYEYTEFENWAKNRK